MGIDLAWISDNNPSAMAIGSLQSAVYENCAKQDTPILKIEQLFSAVYGLENILSHIKQADDLSGIAIDASLIINNIRGKRACELQLSKAYARRHAACHPCNLSLYPNADSVKLSKQLKQLGFAHLAKSKWQIECYPHPAIIECFGLKKRLAYKKGWVDDKRQGQIQFADYLQMLKNSPVLRLEIAASFQRVLEHEYILSLKGQALKSNEDSLDALMCLYIAGLYAIDTEGKLFGDKQQGYIWVPQVNCLQSA